MLGLFKSRKAPVVISPWEDLDRSLYLGRYTEELERVARRLSQPGTPVAVRYNKKNECAEIYVPDSGVVAHVHVWGEHGTPEYLNIISFSFNLPDSTRNVFEKVFEYAGLRIRFEMKESWPA